MKSEPVNGGFLNTLGAAQYRVGDIEAALRTLTRSDEWHQNKSPADAAFLAMTHYRLGDQAEALRVLERLRRILADPGVAQDTESQALLREAEALIRGGDRDD